ncbi:MAG: hypothetical protein R3B68_10375 [Phycisphaerales bacterium]
MGGVRAMAALAVVGLGVMPGCIVQDIHDRLEETSLEMADANRNLEAVSAQLATTQAMLDVRLAQIDVTNERLRETLGRLERLESIEASLHALDLHLASLRRTLSNIDSAIPFLGIVDSATDEETAEEAAEEPATPTPPGSGAPNGSGAP